MEKIKKERVSVIGVKISNINMDKCLKIFSDSLDDARGKYICAANVHTTVMAHENRDYKKIQENSFLTLPDGKPLSVVGKKKGCTEMGRVTGPEFMENILENSIQKGWTHYLYGNTEENLNLLIKYLKKKYPNLNIVGYEPSIFRELSDSEKDDLIQRINKKNPDFVWIGLGAPRQEIFCSELSDKTNSIWVGVGGAFNVIAGTIPRAPQWMQDHGLEWLYRLMKEPKRLFKRYFVTNSKFILYLIKDMLGEKE